MRARWLAGWKMAAVWFYESGSYSGGPLTIEELRLALHRQPVPARVKVWRAGLSDWKAAAEVAELSGLLADAAPSGASIVPAIPPPPTGPAAGVSPPIAAATPTAFEVGRVVAAAAGTLNRNAGSMAALTIVLAVLPGLASAFIFGPTLTALMEQPSSAMFASPIYWLSSATGIVANCLFYAAVTYMTVVDLDGREPEFAATIVAALRCAVPLVAQYILAALGIAVGLLLLVVPGLILLSMWSVAGAPLVVERAGIVASLGRSRALTKGSRGRIFGIFFVYIFASSVVSALLARLVDLLGMPAPALAVMDTLVGAAGTLIFFVVTGAIYVELRTLKEGASTTKLAAIFA